MKLRLKEDINELNFVYLYLLHDVIKRITLSDKHLKIE